VSPFAPEAAAFRAGKLMLKEIALFAKQGVDFGFEATLAGRSYTSLLRDLKGKKYNITIFFLWIPTVEVAISRIRDRVLKGGHNVPEVDVRSGFGRSISNFLKYYRELADSWILFDNSDIPPSRIAFSHRRKLRVIKADAYNILVTQYGKL